MNFHDEIVLITGASNGIGRGLALSYAEQGATVIACDKDEEHGRQLVGEIRENGGNGFFFYCDVRDPKNINELFDEIKQHVGTISILINNAGVSSFQPLFELDIEQWDDVIQTNLRSIFLFSKQAGKLWKNEGVQGRIVNMASTRAFMSEPDSEAYAASKGGIIALTHALASSLSHYNIRVNSISPGWIQTENYEQLREVDHEQHLSNRVGKVEDVAKACFYLTDRSNDFVTGENLTVDGGMTRKMIYKH
ncbi:oxidoreductase [Halobacillus halophilus]|uniref:Short-chain dehydrogenase/reductase family protein n=2 Tax=Halobacillus TaxID=45667 RepID=I0JLS7_HALH3|nr:SDR family oxidoreductase [Halobacillus halophilus]ASF39199.1 oxidoreductase [Halobacillus halophilus]CCG45097.1 short-chain dehydrogenase/reductase family protein [Halobacillus halophilus DSM 2266]